MTIPDSVRSIHRQVIEKYRRILLSTETLPEQAEAAARKLTKDQFNSQYEVIWEVDPIRARQKAEASWDATVGYSKFRIETCWNSIVHQADISGTTPKERQHLNDALRHELVVIKEEPRSKFCLLSLSDILWIARASFIRALETSIPHFT